MTWDNRYRPLNEGETILSGDECLTDSHLGWQPATHDIGEKAPDPNYTAHRMYRRLLKQQCQNCGSATNGEEAWVDGQIWCHPCADKVDPNWAIMGLNK